MMATISYYLPPTIYFPLLLISLLLLPLNAIITDYYLPTTATTTTTMTTITATTTSITTTAATTILSICIVSRTRYHYYERSILVLIILLLLLLGIRIIFHGTNCSNVILYPTSDAKRTPTTINTFVHIMCDMARYQVHAFSYRVSRLRKLSHRSATCSYAGQH